MLQISEVCIISIDKGEDSWAIEGEVMFEEDLSSLFEVTYLPEDDDLDDFSMELTIDDTFDYALLKDKIKKAAMSFED